MGVKNNKLPLFKSFDVILYTISTAFILWVVSKNVPQLYSILKINFYMNFFFLNSKGPIRTTQY